jgi:CBS domain-containing protein
MTAVPIEGIVSERDIAYGLVAHGSQLPSIAVSKLMTKAVVVCSPEDSIIDIMKLMTQRRIRHLPDKDGNRLVEIVSIGDVLKHRLGEVCFAIMPSLLDVSAPDGSERPAARSSPHISRPGAIQL